MNEIDIATLESYPDQIIIKDQDYGKDFLIFQNLDIYWNNRKFSDITIICSGKRYMLHGIVLASCSNYFQNIFDDFTGNELIFDMSTVVFESLFMLCYGIVNVKSLIKNFLDIAVAADFFEMNNFFASFTNALFFIGPFTLARILIDRMDLNILMFGTLDVYTKILEYILQSDEGIYSAEVIIAFMVTNTDKLTQAQSENLIKLIENYAADNILMYNNDFRSFVVQKGQVNAFP